MDTLIDENYIVRTYRCPESGVVVSEQWGTSKFPRHRTGGPAVIDRDRDTGTETFIGYFENNLRHREGGLPSDQEFDKEGNLIWQAFRVRGEYERENDLPHCEEFDPETGQCIRAEYRIKNPHFRGLGKTSLLHRMNGPAVLTYDRLTGELTGATFYRSGRKQSPPSNFRLEL